MIHLEPAYLRYIYDGLIKGSIHPENAAELPDGLIGMYEVAFDERISVLERQKLLQRFTIWALLKKEVSAAFVAEVLGEAEDDIQEFISTYSAWFNSPESGKYQLYHERLKVYLLQKLSEREVHVLHEKLIGRLELAIQEQKSDEFEWYGLEFLTSHLSIASMLNGDGKKLIELAYSQAHWQRQLKVSKGFSWTKNGLKEVMILASKYNDNEVIECGLQLVDLYYHEQNAAPQILALLVQGDYDSVLKRIEQFGGSDKEDLQRKFNLYMLCLMELTVLDNNDISNRKVGIEKLLKHLDEQLPVDHSVLNWSDFFPSKLMFDILISFFKQNISIYIISNRSNYFDLKFLMKSEILTELEINLILEIFLFNTEASFRTTIMISEISNFLYSNNYVHEANILIKKARDFSNSLKGNYRDTTLKSIISAHKFQKNNNHLTKLISAIDSEFLRKEVYLRSNEDVELFDDFVFNLISDMEFVEERLRLLQIGIETCLVKNKSLDKLINLYIDNLEELDIFEQPEFQVFLVDTFCKHNLVGDAIEIADSIELTYEREIAYSFIAMWYYNNDEENIFDDYLEKINSAEIKSLVYSDLIVSIRNENLKESFTGFYELLVSELWNIDSYATDDWGITEYPRNDLIHKVGMKFQTNGFTEMAIELGSLLIDEWNSKQEYYSVIFSEFDFLKDGVLSPYFLEYILKAEREIDIRKRNEYLIQIIKGYWVSGQLNNILFILPEITNSIKQKDIISDLVFLSLESLNFSFLLALLDFVNKEYLQFRDYFLSKALRNTEVEFEFLYAKQIFNYFLDNKEKNSNLTFFVARQFEFNRPILGIKLIELIEDPYWKVTGLEDSVYYFARLMDVENGKNQLDCIEELKGRFKLKIDVNRIEMKFYDIISSIMYSNHDESWIEYSKKSISLSNDKEDKGVINYGKFSLLLRANKLSELLDQIALVIDDWDRSRVINSFGMELFRVENIEVIDEILSLYPENQKMGSPEFEKFISNYILLCEENDQCKYLVKHYKYFESSWSKSLELAKRLCKINRMKAADQVLNSIDDSGKGSAYIYFAEFMRINYFEKGSEPYLEIGISISMRENALIGIKNATVELIKLGNYSLAEKISYEIKTIKDRRDCWTDIGRTLNSSNPAKLIDFEFQDIELKKFANRGWFDKQLIHDVDKLFVFNHLPQFIEDVSIIETMLEKYFLGVFFLNEISETQASRFDKTLNLNWAIYIKNQLN